MTWRAPVQAALEALEVGDQAYAVAVLQNALENDVAPANWTTVGTVALGYPCPSCGLRFQWPGLRDAHAFQVHAGTVRP